MELTDIERDVQTYRSKIGDLRRQTKDCMWFGPNGETKVSDPIRLKGLTDEIARRSGLSSYKKLAGWLIRISCRHRGRFMI